MLILLPPSETKHPGGDGVWDTGALTFPALSAIRERVVDALIRLCADEDEAARVLGLGPRQRNDVAVNRALRGAPSMAAIDRYTGVLFDALDVTSLDESARAWLGQHAIVHSALLGPVGALDPLPAYRLGPAVRLPGLPSPRALWRSPVSVELKDAGAPMILDMRSEAYVALGPAPPEVSTFVRVYERQRGGGVRALSHFNKAAKGRFVRALARDRPVIAGRDDLRDWARSAGWELEVGVAGSESRLLV